MYIPSYYKYEIPEKRNALSQTHSIFPCTFLKCYNGHLKSGLSQVFQKRTSMTSNSHSIWIDSSSQPIQHINIFKITNPKCIPL